VNYKIVSFATDDDYQRYASRLSKNLDELGADYVIETVPSDRTKQEHCLYKPGCIKKYLTDKPVLWLDVDSLLKDIPILPSSGFDVGFCRNPWKTLPITAAAIYFSPSRNGHQFLQSWKRLCGQWKEGQKADHWRLCQIRNKSDHKELDITPMLRNKLIVFGVGGKDVRPV